MEFVHRLLTLSLAIVQFPFPSSGKATTCTAGDFAVGQNASLMCFFPDDIDAHDSVYIVHYPFSAPTNASDVLLCKLSEVKSSTCKGKDGVALTRYTRNTLFVQIVNVTEHAMGRYMCQFVPPDLSPRDLCNLTVHGTVTPSSADTHHSTTSGEKQDAPTNSQTGGTGTVSVYIIVAVIMNVLVVAFVAVVAVVVCKSLQYHRQRSKKRPIDSAVPLLVTQNTRFSSPAASSAPTETREQSRRESVTTPAAGSVEKPPFVTQESVESYMQPLADFVVGKNSASQPSQNSSKTAMPSVEDGIEMDSGVDLSSMKCPDTDQLKLSSSKENISDNYEKKKNPMSLAKDSNKSDPASLLVGIYRALDGLGERLRLVEEVTSSSARSLTSHNAKNSEDILEDLLREQSKSGTQLEQERDRIQKLLGQVQRGEVDPQTCMGETSPSID